MPGNEIAIAPSHVYLDESGDLVQSSASYNYPPTVEPPDQALATLDPTFVSDVPYNAIPE